MPAVNIPIQLLPSRRDPRSPCRETPQNRRFRHTPGIRQIRRRRAGRRCVLSGVCRPLPSLLGLFGSDWFLHRCTLDQPCTGRESHSGAVDESSSVGLKSHTSRCRRQGKIREGCASPLAKALSAVFWSCLATGGIRMLFPPDCIHLFAKSKWDFSESSHGFMEFVYKG